MTPSRSPSFTISWTEDEFESDLKKIISKDYANLSYPQLPEPFDPSLHYRHQFVQLLHYFEQNNFPNLDTLGKTFIPEILHYLSTFDLSFLTESRPAPPFDHMLLVFIVSTWTQPTYALLVKLFRDYQRVLSGLSSVSGRVFLNDRTHLREISVECSEAVQIVGARIDYIAELVASLLYSNGQHQLLSAFLTDFASPTQTENEETLSHLGRMALACGDGQLAVAYFKRVVSDKALATANQGYVSYFGNNFTAAQNEFSDAKAA